ncbi:helix-turn-helix transcriptional regulator [Coprococcus sp. AF21-14LB]|uniref:helix-turn-helix transcriptional regulator n=1 Tax=Coprococcus sp. AF21-14LB TaxID=2292231 RepID=UPI0013141618|nr:WYL domain-containing protein [Coprococcus sp. AF21-14LB]
MMDAVQQARCVSVAEANKIREKLLELTSKRGRSRFSHMMMPISCNVEVDTKLGEYIEIMLEAMFMHKKIQFQYTEINDNMEKVLRREGKVYILNLYTIYWSDNNYYLIGSHDNHDGLTSYRLDRVENLTISEEYSIDAKEKIGQNPELYIQEYIEKSVNHFSGESIRIEVEYEPNQVTNAILYDFAGSSVKVRKQANGSCRAVFSKMNSVTLTGWFMQYANMFKVIEPEKLRNELQEQLKEAVKNYEK